MEHSYATVVVTGGGVVLAVPASSHSTPGATSRLLVSWVRFGWNWPQPWLQDWTLSVLAYHCAPTPCPSEALRDVEITYARYEAEYKEPFLFTGSGTLSISLNVNKEAWRPDFCWHIVLVRMNQMTDLTHGGRQRWGNCTEIDPEH